MNQVIVLGVGMFTVIVLTLVAVILTARARMVTSGNVNIVINGEKTLSVPAGDKLLQTLAAQNVFLASACGGGGTCAQCKCIISEGGGSMLPTEEPHFTPRDARDGWRLSCQTSVKQDMEITVPEEVFGIKQWECTVESNPNVATFIKELTLKLPEGENVDFRAGGTCSLKRQHTPLNTATSMLVMIIGEIGNGLDFLMLNQKLMSLSFALTRWLIIQARKGW